MHDICMCTHVYIYLWQDGRSWNKTLNDLSRKDKNSRNSCRYIKLSIVIRSTRISALSLLGTQDELSQAMAAVEWLYGKVPAAPRAVFCCPLSCLWHTPLKPLKQTLFFPLQSFLVLDSVSPWVPLYLLSHFSYWWFVNKIKRNQRLPLFYPTEVTVLKLVLLVVLVFVGFLWHRLSCIPR